MPLTDAKLRALRPDGRMRKISDSAGLHVMVTPQGAKLWRFSYRFLGRQKTISFGPYPLVSLSEAREARDAARKQLLDGIDPSQARIQEQRRKRLAADNTFGGVAEEWFRSRRRRWVKSYADRLRSRLDADLMPRLGDRPIAEIEPLEVLDVIRRIERRDAIEMAKRVMQMASAIFRYGVATARCPRDPTADLRGALKEPGPPKHRSALDASELPEFLRRLEAYDGDPTTRLALELIVHTFVRTSEVRFARWSEFQDLEGEKPVWRISAERMKMRRPHIVPLSRQVVEILRGLKRWSGNSGFLLPAPTAEGVISGNTMIFALYRMGYHGRATVHGFRSTASTVLNEEQFNRDWIEMQLAHSDQSVRAVYNAAQWLPGRREMMQWWSDYLDEAKASAEPLMPADVASVPCWSPQTTWLRGAPRSRAASPFFRSPVLTRPRACGSASGSWRARPYRRPRPAPPPRSWSGAYGPNAPAIRISPHALRSRPTSMRSCGTTRACRATIAPAWRCCSAFRNCWSAPRRLAVTGGRRVRGACPGSAGSLGRRGARGAWRSDRCGAGKRCKPPARGRTRRREPRGWPAPRAAPQGQGVCEPCPSVAPGSGRCPNVRW